METNQITFIDALFALRLGRKVRCASAAWNEYSAFIRNGRLRYRHNHSEIDFPFEARGMKFYSKQKWIILNES